MLKIALIPSIFLFFGIISIIYAAAVHYFLKVKDHQAVQYWSLGSLIWGCAILLTIFRQELPLFLSYFIANGVAFVAYVVMNRALRCLLEEIRNSFKFGLIYVGIFVLYTCALFALSLWTPNEFSDLAKTTFVSALVVVVSLQGAQYCYLISVKHKLKIAQNFAYLYLLVAFLWSARIISAAAFQATHAFDPGLLNTVIWVAMFITGVVKYMIFPLMLLQKNEKEKQDQLKKSLARANKTVTSSALSASIAHELNQPLAAIRINSQILLKLLSEARRDLPSDSSLEIKTIVSDILEDNERASKIIMTLRSIFRQTPRASQLVNSALLIQASIQLLKKEIEKRSIVLEMNLVKDAFIQIPDDEFHQLMMNLIYNSMDALSENADMHEGKLVIESKYRDGKLDISVFDNGPGIGLEIEESLFEILSTNKDSGMGIGLWLCKYIVDRHGGTIFHQKSILGGACFTISLPCQEAHNFDLSSSTGNQKNHPIA